MTTQKLHTHTKDLKCFFAECPPGAIRREKTCYFTTYENSFPYEYANFICKSFSWLKRGRLATAKSFQDVNFLYSLRYVVSLPCNNQLNHFIFYNDPQVSLVHLSIKMEDSFPCEIHSVLFSFMPT